MGAFIAGSSLVAAPLGAATTKSVVVADATVTAARANGNSAVELTITNDSKGPISLTSVSSPVSAMSMIYYDENMCQGNHTMAWLANIFIEPGHVQKLALKFQGAMLGELRSPLVKGSTVPLVLKWSNFQVAKSVTIEAKVIAAPKGLRFRMSAMNMKM